MKNILSKAFSKPAFVLVSCLLINSVACAIDTVVLVANSSHFSLLHRIETAIYSQPGIRPQVMRVEAEELTRSEQFKVGCKTNCRLIVAVGSQATKAVLKTKTNDPILSILIRKQAYEQITEEYEDDLKSDMQLSALYLDHPFERQLALIEAVLSSKNGQAQIGVLLGPTSIRSQKSLEKGVLRSNQKLNVIKVNNQDYAIAALDVLLEDVNVILALPDPAIYNSRTARGLLLSAYRKQVPLVGFSRTYVSNGALAAVYSTPKQIANQSAEMIKDIMKNEPFQLPKETYPDSFSVAINYQVARSLGLDIESEVALHYLVKQQDGYRLASCHKNDMPHEFKN